MAELDRVRVVWGAMGLGLEHADAAVELGRSSDVLVLGGEGPDEGGVVGPDLWWEGRVPRCAVGWGIVTDESAGLAVEGKGEGWAYGGQENEKGVEVEGVC